MSSDACRIPDPFIGFNELDVEWVGETAWTYRRTLPTVDEVQKHMKIMLAFDGLDTFATVRLNGATILKSDNMFIPYRVDVTQQLLRGKENVLEVEFQSALRRAREIRDAHPEHKWVGFNGDMARLAVRKAQYHWYRQIQTPIPPANQGAGAGTGVLCLTLVVPGKPFAWRHTCREYPTCASITA